MYMPMAILHTKSTLPVNVTNNLSLMFAPGFFYQMGNNNLYQVDTTTQLYINLTFKISRITIRLVS